MRICNIHRSILQPTLDATVSGYTNKVRESLETTFELEYLHRLPDNRSHGSTSVVTGDMAHIVHSVTRYLQSAMNATLSCRKDLGTKVWAIATVMAT